MMIALFRDYDNNDDDNKKLSHFVKKIISKK